MAGLFQIFKKKPTDSMNFLVVIIPLSNGSECPSQLILYTNKRFSSSVSDDQGIIKIIRNLNINMAHSHDDISMRIIRICD